MAKNMARIAKGIVVNVEWWPEKKEATENLIDIDELPVTIGDSYDGADFYRDGEKLLSPVEQLRAELAQLQTAVAEVQAQ